MAAGRGAALGGAAGGGGPQDRPPVRGGGVRLGLDREGGEGQLSDELIGGVLERVRPHRADGHGQSWAGCGAPRADQELLDAGLTVVKAGELLAREGVVVPERTLHRYALRCWATAAGASTTVRVADGEPGAECQVDFGKMGLS